jgi:FMN phosphatase YigB (HAD superfamily)
VFAAALRALSAEPGDAVMVGDSLPNDVDGALAAGLRAVWVNRAGAPLPTGRGDLVEIRDLGALSGVLAALG